MNPSEVSPGGIESFVLLLVIATIVSLATRRIRVPYTVALVVVGLLLGHSATLVPEHGVSRDVLLLLFLPPLLFEGTLAMDLGMLRANWREVGILALGVTALCFLALGAAAHYFLGFAWPVALLVGAILSPTDPVSVLAIMRESAVTRRLSLLIEAESCFNDGIGVVLYLIVASVVAGHAMSAPQALGLFVREALGGVLVGALLGVAVHNLLSRIDDHLTETMISLALAYGAYAAAERFHVSGIMAVIAAGLIIGNYGRVLAMSPETRMTLSAFWEVLAFLANSILFLLMGVAVQEAPLWPHIKDILLLFGVLLVARQVIVYGAVWLMKAVGCAMPRGWGHFIGWSGLRGSIPIALALGLVPWAGPGVPERTQVVSLIFGVVLLSLLVQGLTIRPLLQRLRLVQRDPEEEAFEEQVARRIALLSASRRLEEMNDSGQVPHALYEEIRTSLDQELDAIRCDMTARLSQNPGLTEARRGEVAHALQLARLSALERAVTRGFISNETYARLRHSDLESVPLDEAGGGSGDGREVPA